jgi:hypothetical protein
MAENFQNLGPPLTRDSWQRFCSIGLTQCGGVCCMPAGSIMFFSTVGTTSRKLCLYNARQSPMPRGAPARLYQLRSKITISHAAGK